MQKLPLQESITLSEKGELNSDMEYFIKTLSDFKNKEVRPDLISSIITHYASKWLPDISGDDVGKRAVPISEESPKSVMASWMKKKLFIETLVGNLPTQKDSVPCDLLLRLLRLATMMGVESSSRVELEKRISWQLDQASLKELMIPSFSHTCSTLLDVELFLRLVTRFVSLEESCRTSAALPKVAKLVDCYLAEAAVDSHLTLPEFVALASAVPSHARYKDDGLYRAIDTYLKAHPGLSKQERKRLCSLLDSRKLSPEASFHAAQNERLPVRAVIQILLSEQTKLYKHIDWSGSLSGMCSPGIGLADAARCQSKRETNIQQMEIKRLKEDVLMLQSQCMSMERQIEKLSEKKRGYFSWKNLGNPVFGKTSKTGEIEGEAEASVGLKTPLQTKTRSGRGRRPSLP